ncbi:hypothetical protein ABZ804_21970 [Streptomyces sp. NPDC047726]|uniref:hypothetical protein n=1 Tax=Streptomyces sp. NPDC047726 TaxID=3156651 RepID=UPI003400E299
MQTPTELEIAVYREGGDPEKVRVYVTVAISDAQPAMPDLAPAEREAVLQGALDGIQSALPDDLDTVAVMTRTELVELV